MRPKHMIRKDNYHCHIEQEAEDADDPGKHGF